MSDEKVEMRASIAGSQVECPALGNDHPAGCHCNLDGCDNPCTACKDTPGKVYRFGDALRAKCLGDPSPTLEACKTCEGRGWAVPENFFALLLVELRESGWPYRIHNHSVEFAPPGQPLSVVHTWTLGDVADEEAIYHEMLKALEAAP